MPSGVYLSQDRFQQLQGDLFEQDARGVVADTFHQQATAALPDMVAEAQRQADEQARQAEQAKRDAMAEQFMASVPDALSQHLGNAAPDTTTVGPASAAGGTPPESGLDAVAAPATPPSPAAQLPTEPPFPEASTLTTARLSPPSTTAELSGAPAGSGKVTSQAHAILAASGDIALHAGYSDAAARALQATLVTEGGLNGARGDKGQSAGPLQFYTGGQLANFARQYGMSMDDAKTYVEAHPLEAVTWALGTPDKPGYLGAALLAGQRAGLQGADLATYIQQHGQVSVSPERAGQNYNALFAGGGDPFAGIKTMVSGAVDTARRAVGDLVPNQFASGLSASDAAAACGPAAAVAFARANGRNPTMQEALDLAKQTGWTVQGGMNGIANQKALLDRMGIAATLDPNPSWSKISADAASGNPVTISTPLHYFVADGFDPQTGKYHVGASGTAFRGGSDWLTAGQMQQLAGGINGALFADHPNSPNPSTAVGDQRAQAPVRNALATLSGTDQQAASTSPTSPTSQPQQSMWDKLGTGISDVFKNIFAGGSTLMAGQESVGRGTTQAADAVTGATGGAIGTALSGAGEQMQTGLDLQRRGQTQIAGAVGTALTEEQPWMRNLVGATTALDPNVIQPNAADLTPQQQAAQDQTNKYVQARGLATGLAQTVVPEDIAARATTSGAGSLGRSAEVAQELATSKQPAQANVGFAAGMPPPRPPASTGPSASANPLIQRTGQMLEAKPPEPQKQGIIERIVQATTNRTVAADRYQEDALRAAGGFDLANPPEHLDLSAALRLASDPAAEIRLQQGLRPALQQVGEDRPWLSTYLMHANNVDVAAALGNVDRTFPGGFKAADSAQVLADLPAELGPQRFAQVQQAASQIYDFTKQLRQRMVSSGLIDAQTAQQWEQQYPHWVPTRVLDYMDEAGGPRVGSKISLADAGVKKYTEEGTAKFAEDPLASIIGLTRQVESKAMKNDAANALVELDNLRPTGQRLLQSTDRPVTVGESVIQRINNGTVERYVAPPSLAAVINGPQITQAPNWVRAWTGFIRSMTTILSPTFALIRNPSLDIPEYLTRELARSGGNPLVIPHLVAELARGYADAFKGFSPLTEGVYAGAGTRQFMLGGGGSAGEVPRTFAQRGDAVARLAQDGVDVTSAGDVGRALKDLITLKPVARTAERTELGPRIASMRLADERGATPVRAILNGRSVTLDFNEGGTVAKTLNQFIPFFNAGVQGSAQVTRMFRENPTGAVVSAMTMAGLPAIAAEAWNNSDPQRAKDYNDVPDYLKSQGVVVMMPGEAPTDDKGNRRPQFWWINMRGLAPFSSLARDASAQVLKASGNKDVQPDDWGKLLADLGFGISPIRANTVGDVPGALSGQGFIPGADVGLQLMTNKDFFRKSDIVTPHKDQYASAVGWTVANALTNLARTQDPSWQVHPAQVDFAVQQLLGGVGSSALGLGNIVAGQRRDNAPQSAPVIGGAVRALGLRGDTGQMLQDARGHILTPDAQRVLNDAALVTPKPEPGTVHLEGFAVPLLQAEQAEFQKRYTDYMSAGLVRYAKQLTSTADMVVRQDLMNQIGAQAQERAKLEVLQSIPRDQLNQRIRTEDARRRVGGRP